MAGTFVTNAYSWDTNYKIMIFADVKYLYYYINILFC